MPAWPVGLPQSVLLEGLGLDPRPQQLVTEMEVGPPKSRRRSSADVTEVPCALILTGTELSTLETFYKTTLLGGSLTFTHPHPWTAVSANWLFVGRYRVTALAGHQTAGSRLWRVVFTLLIVP